MNKTSENQAQNYRWNITKHVFISEKEKYAKRLEDDIFGVQLPINNNEDLAQGGRRIPLGKLVT